MRKAGREKNSKGVPSRSTRKRKLVENDSSDGPSNGKQKLKKGKNLTESSEKSLKKVSKTPERKGQRITTAKFIEDNQYVDMVAEGEETKFLSEDKLMIE